MQLTQPISITENIDCMEFMQRFPDNYFDLAVVDPPYGIGEDGRKTKRRTFRKDGTAKMRVDKRTGRKAVIYNTYKNGEWDSEQPPQKYFDELVRVSKNQIIWGENYLNFNQKKTSSGRIFWDKINGTTDFADGEIAWVSSNDTARKFEFMWNGMLQGAGVRSGKVNQGNKNLCEKRIHPTQKPVALYDWIFSKYAKPGDKILDTHLGSGSSRISANKAGLDFWACELDPEYFADQEKRYKNFVSQLRMF